MRKISLFIWTLVFVSLTFANVASAIEKMGPYSYTNSAHQQILRWIEISNLDFGRSLFLVVDHFPVSETPNLLVAGLPQVTIDREVVPTSDSERLHKLENFYSTLADLAGTDLTGDPANSERPAPGNASPKELNIHGLNFHPAVLQPMTGRPLWVPAKTSWSSEDEDAYSEWIAKRVDLNLMKGSSTKADCADLAILLRWVYARDHKLPVADTLSGSSQLFGHFSSNAEWDKLKEDPDWHKDLRFQAALAYVLNNTYTHSLWGDLYPTTIDKNHVRPGTVYIFLRDDDGHTQTIKSVGPNPDVCGDADCIVTYWGNEPATQQIFVSSLIEPNVYGGMGNKRSGFMAWRWPRIKDNKWELTPGSQMNDYSNQQYSPSLPPTGGDSDVYRDEYWAWLEAQVGMRPPSPLASLKMNLSDFQKHIQARLYLTASAQIYCVFQSCPAGTPAQDAFSTPEGDAEMDKISSDAIKHLAKVDPNDPALKVVKDSYSTLAIFGQSDSYTYWNLALNNGNILPTFSSQADANFAQRWGLQGNLGQPDLEYPILAVETQLLYKTRDMLVESAQESCYPGGTSTLSCNPKSEQIQSLNTKSLDVALTQLQSKMAKAGVGSFVQDSVKNYLSGIIMVSDGGVSGDDVYTVYDEVLGSGANRIQRWSQLPTDPVAKRWGW